MRILLANDDYNFGYVLRKELEEQSYIVDVVNDGIDAIYNFIGNEYGFILMEVLLPKLNGLDTLKIIDALMKYKKINSNAQIIIFSCENEICRNELIHYGSVKYFKKPFNIESLVSYMKCSTKNEPCLGES